MTHVDINSRPRASGAAHPTEALAGLWVPLVTPLTQDGGLDERSLTQLVDHVIDGGADGLFLWGTTSEAASLGARMGRRVTACVMRRLASRRPSGFPCVVCVSDPCLETSIEMARYAWRFHEAGMIGVAATPPYYYPMNDEELRRYFETLSMATPAPVILYNFPDLAKTPLRADLVAELAELPGIVGLKDSSGDTAALAAVLQRVGGRDDFSVLAGDEKALVANLRAGATGGVCGTANLTPTVFQRMIRAVAEGRHDTAANLERRVKSLHGIYRVGSGWSRCIANLKAAMALLGLCESTMAPPLSQCSPNDQKVIAHELEKVFGKELTAGSSMPMTL